VRSVEPEHLSEADRLRRSLIAHFATPFAQDEMRVEDLRKLCESPFERDMYDELTQRGYWVTPQVRVGQYRIDMVMEGHNDARLAVECDGDKYHGADKWADDMQRQRVLERAGWVFWRCFASAFIRRRKDMLDDLLKTLAERGIEPIGAEGAPRSVHTEHRVVHSVTEPVSQGALMPVDAPESAQASTPVVPPAPCSSARENMPPVEARLPPSSVDGDLFDRGQVQIPSVRSRDANLPFSDYVEYTGLLGDDPRSVNEHVVSEGIVRIIEVEGPVLAKRVYDIYLRSCGIKRMGHELKSTMNKALSHAIRQGRVICEDEAGKSGILFSVVRVMGSPPIRLRSRGPRSFEELPPSELQVVGRYLLERHSFTLGSDEHLRAVLERFDLKRLTTEVGTTLLRVLERSFPYVEEFLSGIQK
jgi:very-short-patch-repair endonuclease